MNTEILNNYNTLHNAIIEDAVIEWREVMDDNYFVTDKEKALDQHGGYGRRLLRAALDRKYIEEHALNGPFIAREVADGLKDTHLASAPVLRLREGVRLDRTKTSSTITAVVKLKCLRENEHEMIIDFYEAWFGGVYQ